MSERSSTPAADLPLAADQQFTRDDVEIVGEELAYDGFYKVRKYALRHRLFGGGWGGVIRRELVERHEAVGVLLYDPVLDAVGLVEQFRIGALSRADSPWLLEIVAGLIDAGEPPFAVARREAQEEAGCEITAAEPITTYFSSPGGSDEFFHLYCGRCDLSAVGGIHGLAEEGEDIRVRVISADVAFALISNAEQPLNAHLLIALLWLQQHRGRLRALWK